MDIDKVFAFGLPGLLWKRHAIVTLIKYNDNNSEPQTIALDLIPDTKYAQPLIDKKFREVHLKLPAHIRSEFNQSIINLGKAIS